MTRACTTTSASTAARPVGPVEPTHTRAVACLTALRAGRALDAQKHAENVEEAGLIDRAWRYYLTGLVCVDRGEFREAEAQFLQAGAMAFACGRGAENQLDVDAIRLFAATLHETGWVYRRQDRPLDALFAHRAAYQLRARHGSSFELWESAIELGLDHELAHQGSAACERFREAVQHAANSGNEQNRCAAVAWAHLATFLSGGGEHAEAVEAARRAREHWHCLDVGAVDVAQADLKLGGVLLKQGEALCDKDDSQASAILEEAVSVLGLAHNALSAFGPEQDQAVRLCADQTDFAKKLLASRPV